MPSDQNQPWQTALAFLIIALSVALLYISTYTFSWIYHEVRVPRGDPFSYTVSFFQLLDSAHAAYWRTLQQVVTSGNWYWLLNFLFALFSPLLIPEPFSLAMVQYILLAFATWSFYRLARHVGHAIPGALALSYVFWLVPSLYGIYNAPGSLLTLQLDASFFLMLAIAACNTLVLAIRQTPGNALIAGVSVGLAVWGRGNSIPYVAFAIFVPGLVILRRVAAHALALMRGRAQWTPEAVRELRAFGIFCLVAGGMTAWFLAFTLASLRGYYSIHEHLVASDRFSVATLRSIIKLLGRHPGNFFVRDQHADVLIAVASVACHLAMALIAFLVLRKNPIPPPVSRAIRVTWWSGLALFYFNLLAMVTVFNDPAFIGGGHAYLPMLAGMALCVFALASTALWRWADRWPALLKRRAFLAPGAVAALAVLFGYGFTRYYTPEDPVPGADTPREVRALAVGLEHHLHSGSIAWLWYEMYNAPIIDYYRVQAGLPTIGSGASPVRLYSNPFWNTLWNPAERDNVLDVQQALQHTFREADFIVLPKSFDMYWGNEPYPLYIHRDLARSVAAADTQDRFEVMDTLHDQGAALLLLRRVPAQSYRTSKEAETAGFRTLAELFGAPPESAVASIQVGQAAVLPSPPAGSPTSPRLVEMDVGCSGYNIIRAGNTLYALHQSDGEFDLAKIRAHQYRAPVYEGDSVAQVVRQINKGALINASSVAGRAGVPFGVYMGRAHIDRVQASRETGGHDLGRAFDDSVAPDSFWEVKGPYPIAATISLQSACPIQGYVLQVGELGERMPRKWRVMGSQDGRAWKLLDEQDVTAPWKPGETRTFQAAHPQEARQLRFEFLAGFNPDIMRQYEIRLIRGRPH